MKRFAVALLFGALVIAGSWFVVFPRSTLLPLIRNSLSSSGLAVELSGFRKGYFYDFTAEKAAINKSDRTLLTVQDLSCGLDIPSTLILKPALLCRGEIAGGGIRGRVGLIHGMGPLKVNIEEARVEGLPFLSLAGVSGTGKISGRMDIAAGSGDIVFAIRDAHLLPASFGGIRVPLDIFSHGTGALALVGETLRVTSFSLEGSSIYARVKGTIEGNMLNLTMELMPQKSFAEENPVFGLLAAYRDSPGHYSIPIAEAVNF